ncbi:MAG TPA: hypothetical protein VII06_39785 [Chloroflexota bacterium]|jgi:hypothetical protein
MRDELAPAVAWASPYLIAAFGALGVARCAAWWRTRRVERVDLLLLLGGLIFAAYFIKLAANFPKYHVGMLPFWAAALAWWLVDWLAALDGRARLALGGACAATGAYFLCAVRDAWMWTPTLVWEPAIVVPVVALFATTVTVLVRNRHAALPTLRGVSGGLVAALLVTFVGWGLAVSWTQARADYSTNYYYGTRGQREAAAMLDALGYDGVWVGAKEVAWYAHNQNYVDADTFWWLVTTQKLRFEGSVLGEDVRVIVPWTTDPAVRDFFWRQLDGRYEPVGAATDYTVWVRRDDGLVARAPDGPRSPATDAGQRVPVGPPSPPIMGGAASADASAGSGVSRSGEQPGLAHEVYRPDRLVPTAAW